MQTLRSTLCASSTGSVRVISAFLHHLQNFAALNLVVPLISDFLAYPKHALGIRLHEPTKPAISRSLSTWGPGCCCVALVFVARCWGLHWRRCQTWRCVARCLHWCPGRCCDCVARRCGCGLGLGCGQWGPGCCCDWALSCVAARCWGLRWGRCQTWWCVAGCWHWCPGRCCDCVAQYCGCGLGLGCDQ